MKLCCAASPSRELMMRAIRLPLLSSVIVVLLAGRVEAAAQPDRLPLWWPDGLRQVHPITPDAFPSATTPEKLPRVSNPRLLRHVTVPAATGIAGASGSRALDSESRALHSDGRGLDSGSRTLDSRVRHTVVSAVAIVPPAAGQRSPLIAVAGDDHRIRLYDAEHLRLLRTLEGHTDWVRAIAVRPDGKLLATAGNDRKVCFWDLADGTLRDTLEGLPHAVAALAYSPDGRTLAIAGMEGKVRLLIDDGGGRLTRQLEAPGGDIRAVCFSPDGRHVAAAGRTEAIRIWETATGRQTMQIALPGGTVHALAYWPDGSLIAAAGSRGQVQLWNAADGQPAGTLGKDLGTVMSLALVGKQYIAAGTSSNLIHVWNLDQRSEHHRLVGHTGSVAALKYDPAANVLISAGYDCTLRVWELSP